MLKLEARNNKAGILSFNSTLAQARIIHAGFTQLFENTPQLPAEAQEMMDSIRAELKPLAERISDRLS